MKAGLCGNCKAGLCGNCKKRYVGPRKLACGEFYCHACDVQLTNDWIAGRPGHYHYFVGKHSAKICVLNRRVLDRFKEEFLPRGFTHVPGLREFFRIDTR